MKPKGCKLRHWIIPKVVFQFHHVSFHEVFHEVLLLKTHKYINICEPINFKTVMVEHFVKTHMKKS